MDYQKIVSAFNYLFNIVEEFKHVYKWYTIFFCKANKHPIISLSCISNILHMKKASYPVVFAKSRESGNSIMSSMMLES